MVWRLENSCQRCRGQEGEGKEADEMSELVQGGRRAFQDHDLVGRGLGASMLILMLLTRV